MGAARPAGASQPFLPACFLIDTAAYISRARCCSSEAWRLAKPSQTDSRRCFLSQWALRVPRALDVQQRCGGPFLGCCGGPRIKPPSRLGGRIPLHAHLKRGVGSFCAFGKPETASRLKAGFGSLSGRIAAQRCSGCCVALSRPIAAVQQTFERSKSPQSRRERSEKWTLPHRRRRHGRARAPTPSPAAVCASTCAASATAI